MDIAALITWLITAVAGFTMLGIWISKGGQRGGSASRLAPSLLFSHFILAVVGLVLWIIYIFAETDALAWIAFILLLPVAALGLTMFARWRSGGGSGTAESRFPPVVVYGHGLFAVVTLILVLLAALGVGVD